MLFQRILVPLDGSDHSVRALECAVQMAKNFRGCITLVHVFSVTAAPIFMPEPSTLSPSGVPVVTPAEVSRMVEASREGGHQILR